MSLKKIFPLIGGLQPYVWGGKNYLPELLHLTKNNDHYAEWWLGTHPALPSLVKINEENLALSQLIAKNPQLLDEQSRQTFGENLPFLLKILDVAEPLSIQLHPTKAQAEIGFEEENKKNIPLNAPHRTYKDRNHKPEMMMALSDFWLLHGFKKKADIIQSLNAHASLKPLAEKLQNEEIKNFYADIMQANQKDLKAWLLPIIEKQQQAFNDDRLSLSNPDYWLLYSIQAMNISLEQLDAGLLCFYLFNLVHLKKGEGIFQGAGIPHAYLRGQNIELMATSDNVIRGGLTPKFVNVRALLEVVDCQEITPEIFPAPTIEKTFHFFPRRVEDFRLGYLGFKPQEIIDNFAENAEILLVMEGEIYLQAENETLVLKQGESAFIGAKTRYQIHSKTQGFTVLATC